MVYHRSANLEQSCLYTYSSNTCEAAAARCNKHPLPAQAQSPYLKFWPPFCELWLWFSFNSETFLENGSKKRRRQSGRWFSWAWRAWLDSIAVPVFAVWLNLTNTETTPLNLLQNLWSASVQWKVLEKGCFWWISSVTYINPHCTTTTKTTMLVARISYKNIWTRLPSTIYTHVFINV